MCHLAQYTSRSVLVCGWVRTAVFQGVEAERPPGGGRGPRSGYMGCTHPIPLGLGFTRIAEFRVKAQDPRRAANHLVRRLRVRERGLARQGFL